MTELTLGEFSRVLGYLIDNNRRLVDNGDTPIAVCIEGEAGLGKTAVVQQVAESKGMTFVKINLAQLEEPAELVGYPIKEYKISKDGNETWLSADLLSNMNCTVTATGESRMSYAVPSWLPDEYNPNGTMLVLDDFTRANHLIIQAVMEIINTGSYVSWNLPKHTNIVLTSNPDNGAYNVTGLDNAVKSRMLTFTGVFDIQEWARWAENFGIDDRAINFALLYDNELFTQRNNVVVANARNYTTFCRAISGLPDWSDQDTLPLILEIASGCFLEKDNVIGNLFTTFINNRLDRLMMPAEVFSKPWHAVKTEIAGNVYDNDTYRADIANVLGTRILNYCMLHLGTKKLPADIVENRFAELLGSDVQLLTKDIMYHIIKTLCGKKAKHTTKWFANPILRNVIL